MIRDLRGPQATAWRRIGNALLLAGLLTAVLPVGFALYTNRAVQGAQTEALLDLEWQQAQQTPVSNEDRAAGPGAAVAEIPFVLEIPKIGLRWVIREGTDIDDLRRNGAGHIPGTSLPGEPGIVGIAGHRTTYGAPFLRLNELGPGDEVRIVGADAAFVYRVYYQTQVRPTQVEILEARSADPVLVLISCSPPFSAEFRLAVFARLSRVSREPNMSAR